MGYSISIQVATPKLAQKMIDFLNAHGKSYAFLIGQEKKNEWHIGPFWANPKDPNADKDSKERGGLAYIHRRGHIGFDYGWDREHKFVLLRWMVRKIGVRDPKTKNYRVLYDDDTWLQVEPDKYDDLGMQIKLGEASCFQLVSPSELKLLRAEMKRLNQLWDDTI